MPTAGLGGQPASNRSFHVGIRVAERDLGALDGEAVGHPRDGLQQSRGRTHRNPCPLADPDDAHGISWRAQGGAWNHVAAVVGAGEEADLVSLRSRLTLVVRKG